jgi:hypothetical protein
MNTSLISFDEYVKKFGLHIKPIVRPLCMFDPTVSPPIIPIEKARDYFEVSRIQILSKKDFETLNETHLVWYRTIPQGDPAEWNEKNVKNLRFNSVSDVTAYKPKSARKINRIFKSLMKNGLKREIEIICVLDESLDKTVMIDGTHRALALSMVHLATMEKILGGPHKIYITTLSSPCAALFFPCDFINFYNDKLD